MFELVVFFLIAIGSAAVTAVWAWHDHVVTHPWAARPSNTVERIVDRWERITVNAARPAAGMRQVSRSPHMSR
ncbi:hypothetical protein GXW83_17225 [Streptacidiphilus sp. PB12-B1b]|uniref:hypothetical protein n=1 Tax=Streptacidiphilus sp. PB12-B1b TaxID=2705012 RepID=UPI0015FCB65C|nr:hypothetical protein [Streptacidiphilus sp. PB12-B1b]QMU77189.1 hypothetical protein GXW83_17225 [Streptacidiphilus sp. PB12-B1b]